MAYTRKVDIEKLNRPFATRLRDLMEINGTTQKALSDTISLTPQCIGAYTRGETIPNIEDAKNIAEYFNVSLDYICGNSDVKSIDMNIKKICDVTGLSEKSINYLMKVANIGTEISNISSEDSPCGANIRTELKTINRLIEALTDNIIDEYGNCDESVISAITDFLYHGLLNDGDAVLDICYPVPDEDGDIFRYLPSGTQGMVVHNKDLRSFYLLAVNRTLNALRDEIERNELNGKCNKKG